MKRGIRPGHEAPSSSSNTSWHTFRRTFSTLLNANGKDIKTLQELLRHANSRITLDINTQAVTPAKLFRVHLRPAAKKTGVVVPDRYRFTTFEHSLSNWLVNKAKENRRMVQGVFGHSRVQTTLDLYTDEVLHEIRGLKRNTLMLWDSKQEGSNLACG